MNSVSPRPPLLDVFVALERHATTHRSDALALTDGHETLTYRHLAARIAGAARSFDDLPPVIGVLAPNSVDWFITDLALSFAGKTFVPLPYFFSPQQLAHIVADSGLGHILTDADWASKADGFGVPTSLMSRDTAPFKADDQKPGQRIIYTSGTTGHPKGVRLGTKQINASTLGLAKAVEAGPDDVYLSVLPYPLLLEQISGIHAPVLVGAPVHLAAGAAAACAQGNPEPLIQATQHVQPTLSVLVPDLLRIWVAGLTKSRTKAPDSLRFVAVGGAPVPVALSDAAWALDIPVHEGYGLSECCSVAAVSRPGEQKAGTAGQPLDGLTVTVVDGEIVVRGDTVMDGYLGQDDIDGTWATGDLGAFDDHGNLIVHGRKDNVLVLATGRNVSPEWIEGLLTSDTRLGRTVLIGHGQPSLTAVIVPSPLAGEWFAKTSAEKVADLIADLCAEAPDYARPGKHILISEAQMVENGLLTANGRPRRAAIATYFSEE